MNNEPSGLKIYICAAGLSVTMKNLFLAFNSAWIAGNIVWNDSLAPSDILLAPAGISALTVRVVFVTVVSIW